MRHLNIPYIVSYDLAVHFNLCFLFTSHPLPAIEVKIYHGMNGIRLPALLEQGEIHAA